MKQFASRIGGFVADTSVTLGSSPMRVLALAGYGLTTTTIVALQISQKIGVQ